MNKDKKIFVTQPSLPDLKEFIPLLSQIWDNKQLTNNGPFHKKFEKELADFLGVKYVSLFTNGTLALVAALQVLKISGEVITTPYSFVATTHALWWNNIKPVFVDIEPEFCNLNPDKIEAAITPRTTAILPVHVYGNPASVKRIQEIADIYGLKVIYDAAHAFGVKLNKKSICNFGDLSVLSFHATKVFNTMEGGAIICHDEKTKRRIDYIKNFGFANEITVVTPGINAKMSEFQSALGLLQLKYFNDNITKREQIAVTYKKELGNVKGISCLNLMPDLKYNFAYFPVFINNQKCTLTRNEIYNHLIKNNIFARRYFYPLISQFPTYKGLESSNKKNLPVAVKLSEQVLCLPIYPDLKEEEQFFIINLIKKLV